MNDLIQRIEAATGPDRELDAEIMALFHRRETRHIGTQEGWPDEPDSFAPVMDDVWVDLETGNWVSTHAKYYTASIDAAMTLVPEGFAFACGSASPDIERAWAWCEGPWNAVPNPEDIQAATPALALCAAALRASQDQPHD